MDAKPRELYLLFRAYKGYEGSLLKVTGKQGKNTSPVGFVTFETRAGAEAAKQALQGVRFDPDIPQTLRLEFAKSNTKVSKPKQTSPQPPNAQQALGPHLTPREPYELGAAFFPGAPEAWVHHPLAAYADLGPALHHPAFTHPALHTQPHPAHPAIAPAHPHAPLPQPPLPTSVANAMAAVTGGHAPCSTLFVANLGTHTSEQELRELFAGLPGFSRLRFHNKGGAPCCFVEFQSIVFANQALSQLQGYVMLSSDRGGLRIEFARNKMGDTQSRLLDNNTVTAVGH
ncbi:RNA-binding protein, mRNA-processing factor 2a-like isoform X2 [Ptychodera flava]|uniref:RNA-binding protein, mRNA-processing factor 2a-like isoform X2 n=1 Tax=Ptychodera flava TaxID=63121 RepID=UPI00396A712D